MSELGFADGAALWARDCRRVFLKARVVGRRGEGEQLELRVHFLGWNRRWDEWIQASSRRLRAEEPDEADDSDESEEEPEEAGDDERYDDKTGHVRGQLWEVEKIMSRHVRRDGSVFYTIKWRGWPESHNSKVPADDICDDTLIDEFEASRRRRGGHGSRAPLPPPVAFVLGAAQQQSEEVRAMLATLLTPWLDALGKRLAKQLKRTKEERAATLYQLNVCPP